MTDNYLKPNMGKDKYSNYKHYYAIITTGTSIKSPNNEFGKLKDTEGSPEDWLKSMNKLDPDNQNRLPKISAEINLLNSLKQQNYLEHLTQVTLVHSDTKNGLNAANAVKAAITKYFNVSFPNIELIKVTGLDMSDTSQLFPSMQEIYSVFSDLLGNKYKELQDQTLYLPIGGYKSFTMMAHLIGNMFGFSSWYQHEDSQKPFLMPNLPIEINRSELKEEPLYTFITKLFAENRYSFDITKEFQSLTSSEKQLVQNNQHVFYKVDDTFDFSPFIKDTLIEMLGDEGLFLPNVYIRDKKELGDPSKFQYFLKLFLADCQRHYNRPTEFHDVMHHESKVSNFPNNLQKGIYRQSTSTAARAIYGISEDGLNIYFDRIWYNHDSYENDINKKSVYKLFESEINSQDYSPVERNYLLNVTIK